MTKAKLAADASPNNTICKASFSQNPAECLAVYLWMECLAKSITIFVAAAFAVQQSDLFSLLHGLLSMC